MQLNLSLHLHTTLGLRKDLPRDHQCEDDDENEHPPLREEVCHRDHHACHQRQLTAEALEDLRERRDDLHHDDDQDDDGDAYDEDRICQRGAHLFTVLRAVLVVVIHACERVIECTGQLTRSNGLEEGQRKGFLILFEGMCDGRTALHILGCIQQNLSQLLILCLPGNHFHRTTDRHTGFQRNRKLRAHERQRPGLHPWASELHVQKSARATVFYRSNARDNRTFLSYLRHRSILIHGLHDASDFGSIRGQCFV